MENLNDLLLGAFDAAVSEEHPGLAATVTDEINIFEIVDSFSIVSVLLESEIVVEKNTGRYIPLADESIFDAKKSPFIKWKNWVDYVAGKVNA